MLRAGVPRILIVLFTIALGTNGYYSTVHWTIMTGSIFATITVLGTAFWIDYLRTGRVHFLALVGLFIGIAIGIRPAGLALVPMIAVSAWLKWHQRDVSIALFAAALVLPVTVGLAAERIIYRIEHGARSGELCGRLGDEVDQAAW